MDITVGISSDYQLWDVIIMKIYVRGRTKIGEGVRQPQFKVVATTGDGAEKLKFRANHLRKSELEQIAEDCNATLVYLESTRGAGTGSGTGKGNGTGAGHKNHN